MEAVILIGIQATGKSSFFKERFSDTHIRLNLDMLRTRHRERQLLEACLASKQSFVVDNTNVTARDRARYIAPAIAARFHVVGYYFHSTLVEALQRNAMRKLARAVPERAVIGTSRHLELPSFAEGFNALYRVTLLNRAGYAVQGWNDEI
jgi:predicted kinase